MNIGEIINSRRIELGLTLEEVGNSVGVSKSTVKKWENGFISNMKRDKIANLAKVLKINPVTLITGNDELQSNNNTIHSKRIELGISVKDFANAVGVSESIVNQWEKGTISPSQNEIVKISRILNISIDDLLPKETALFVADSDSVNIIKNKDEILLLNNYKALNKLGKEKLIDYSDDLVSNGKYTDK